MNIDMGLVCCHGRWTIKREIHVIRMLRSAVRVRMHLDHETRNAGVIRTTLIGSLLYCNIKENPYNETNNNVPKNKSLRSRVNIKMSNTLVL